MQNSPLAFTHTYLKWRDGCAEAQENVIKLVYRDLHRLARRMLRHEQYAASLQPTLLANETCLKLLETPEAEWENKQHFLLVAARQMRLLLIDHARRTRAKKRLTYPDVISFDELSNGNVPSTTSTDLVALNEALERFEKLDPRASRVVELRFFFGATEKETAEALNVSLTTVKRDWEVARLWLYEQLVG